MTATYLPLGGWCSTRLCEDIPEEEIDAHLNKGASVEDIEISLNQSGFGPFQLFYLIALSSCWATFASFAFCDKFLTAPQNVTDGDAHFATHAIADLKLQGSSSNVGSGLKIAMYLGMGVGSLLFGIPADKYGAKSVLFPSLAFAVFWILAESLNFLEGDMALWYMKCCRFMTFVGASPFFLASFMWMREMMDEASGPILNIVPNVLFAMGQLTTGTMHRYALSWRSYLISVAGVGGLVFLYLPGILESPRTLANRKSPSAAVEVLETILRVNGVPVVEDFAAPVSSAIGEADKTCGHEGCTARYCANLAIMIVGWMAWAIGFWGIGNENTSGLDVYTDNFWAAISSIPGYCLAYFLSMRIDDRRWILFLLFFPAGILLILTGVLAYYAPAWAPVTNFTAGIFFSGASSVSFVVSPSIFDGKHQNMAMGTLAMSVRFGSIATAAIANVDLTGFGQLLTGSEDYPEGLMSRVLKPIIFGVPSLIFVILLWFLPPGTDDKQKCRHDVRNDHWCMGKFAKHTLNYFIEGKMVLFTLAVCLLLLVYTAGTVACVQSLFFRIH